MSKQILDVCCGSKMFWFDKNNENVVFMDNRVLHDTLCDGRKLDIEPDVVGDFRNIPFDDNTFSMVVGMMSRRVDKTKKSNIKCEHCEAFDNDKELGGWCCIHEKSKNSWNRCKNFIWHRKYNNQV